MSSCVLYHKKRVTDISKDIWAGASTAVSTTQVTPYRMKMVSAKMSLKPSRTSTVLSLDILAVTSWLLTTGLTVLVPKTRGQRGEFTFKYL
jgi:hypothetical protein